MIERALSGAAQQAGWKMDPSGLLLAPDGRRFAFETIRQRTKGALVRQTTAQNDEAGVRTIWLVPTRASIAGLVDEHFEVIPLHSSGGIGWDDQEPADLQDSLLGVLEYLQDGRRSQVDAVSAITVRCPNCGQTVAALLDGGRTTERDFSPAQREHIGAAAAHNVVLTRRESVDGVFTATDFHTWECAQCQTTIEDTLLKNKGSQTWFHQGSSVHYGQRKSFDARVQGWIGEAD